MRWRNVHHQRSSFFHTKLPTLLRHFRKQPAGHRHHCHYFCLWPFYADWKFMILCKKIAFSHYSTGHHLLTSRPPIPGSHIFWPQKWEEAMWIGWIRNFVLIKVVLAISLALVLYWPVGFCACHESKAVSRWGEKVRGAIYWGDQIPDTCFYTRLLNITIGIIYAPEHRDININLNQVCRLGPAINIYSQPDF